MKFSQHNIFSKVKDSDKYFIVNLLSGHADILSPEEAQKIQQGIYAEAFKENGYVVDENQEKKLFQEKYLEFIDNRETDEIQIFFVLSYACNFNCSYCYQEEYINNYPLPSKEMIDEFFRYISKAFSDRKKYITLFGGEPLLPGEKHKELVNYFVQKCNQSGLELAMVTNGYLISEYINTIASAKIREIQVTLDGTEETHNRRRPLHGGKNTFHQIVDGIDLLLKNKIPVNLRVVIDKENLPQLPELAQFAIKKGWTKKSGFKTQLGRNYELHYCQADAKKLYDRIELYEDLYQLLNKNPEIIEFHKPAYSITKFLFENGELPDPLFDSCPGTKTEWAFDQSGKIFSCTATVGKPGEELGSYYPEASLKQEIIETWQDRDVLSIEKCKQCELKLACGGGCASVAKNKTGQILSPDCRPVKELMEMGMTIYGKEFMNE